ncbi:MAG: transcriptional regulator [Agathobacter sp.]
MPYSTLIGEMAKKDVSIEMLAMLLHIHRNTAANKIRGESTFSIGQARLIRDTYFPSMTLEVLFEREDKS